jgi:hypothetical protein
VVVGSSSKLWFRRFSKPVYTRHKIWAVQPNLSDEKIKALQFWSPDTKFVLSDTKFVLSDPKFVLSDVKFVLSDTKFVLSDPKLVLSDPKFVLSDLKFVLSDTKFVLSDTKIVLSDLKLVFGVPKYPFTWCVLGRWRRPWADPFCPPWRFHPPSSASASRPRYAHRSRNVPRISMLVK